MTQEYYIIHNKTRQGPYDVVALVRKIRNGTVTSETQIQLGELPEIKAAQDWSELVEFFGEKKEERPHTPERVAPHGRTLGSTMASGWHFLQRNQYTTVYSGLLVLVVIMISAAVTAVMPPLFHPIAFILCFILAHFVLSCYTLAVLRLTRGQPADWAYIKEKINPAVKSLLLSSVIICFPAYVGVALLTSQLPLVALLLGLFIFAVPGLYALAIYAFTPLLILDQGYDFWDAMEHSRKKVLKNGLEYSGVLYALYVINFIAGLCILIPMALTLPITMGALSEMYDETFGA